MSRPGNTIQINISIPNDLAKKLKAKAKQEKRSLSNFVAYVLETYFEQKK